MKPSIIERYLAREAAGAAVAVLAVLFSVLAANRLIRYLGDAAGGELDGGAIAVLMGLQVLRYLGVVVPAALFLGVVLALGRLYRDNEMPVLAACGVGPWRMSRGLLVLGFPAAALVAVLSLWVAPWATYTADVYAADAARAAEVEGMRAGRFVGGGGGAMYAGGVGPDGGMQDVFIRARGNGAETVIQAERGYQRVERATGDRYLILEDGVRYDGPPGGRGWRITRFERHGVFLEERRTTDVRRSRDGQPPGDLLRGGQAADMAELHWRLAMPAMVLVLIVLAVPLAKANPREGRFGALLTAVLVFVVYFQLVTMGRDWLEQEVVPAAAGLWWLHLLILAAAVFWTRWRFGADRRSP